MTGGEEAARPRAGGVERVKLMTSEHMLEGCSSWDPEQDPCKSFALGQEEVNRIVQG